MIQKKRGFVTVVTTTGSSDFMDTLLADTEAAANRLALLFGSRDGPDLHVVVFWLNRATWTDPKTVYGAPSRLPYGMPFAVPASRAVFLPAVNEDVPSFVTDILRAVPTEHLPKEAWARASLVGYYRAILVHELFHIYWYWGGYPRQPMWLREGMAQLAVLRARAWGRFAEHADRWIRLNLALYLHGGSQVPDADFGTISRSKPLSVAPLAYSWFLGGLFQLYDELDRHGDLLEQVLATFPRKKPGVFFDMDNSEAAAQLSAAAQRDFDSSWWKRSRLLPPAGTGGND